MIEIRTQAEFNTLQTKINAIAASGELIRIYRQESNVAYTTATTISITKDNITIEGVNNPTIQFNGTGSTVSTASLFYISGSGDTSPTRLQNITIRGLRLIGNRSGATNSSAIYAYRCGFTYSAGLTSGTGSRYDSATVGSFGTTGPNKTGITIERCLINSWTNEGIYLTNCDNSQINSVEAVGNGTATGSTIRLEYCKSSTVSDSLCRENFSKGIHLVNSSSCLVNSNTCINNSGTTGYGIYVESPNVNSSYNSITNNLLENNGSYGAYILGLGNCFNNNAVSNNGQGGVSLSGEQLTAVGNSIQNNAGYGLYLVSLTGCTISGNSIQNNSQYGIVLSSVNNISITGNGIYNNALTGVYTTGTTNYVTITGNSIVYNGGYGIQLAGTGNSYVVAYSNNLRVNTSGAYISGGGTGNLYDSAKNQLS